MFVQKEMDVKHDVNNEDEQDNRMIVKDLVIFMLIFSMISIHSNLLNINSSCYEASAKS